MKMNLLLLAIIIIFVSSKQIKQEENLFKNIEILGDEVINSGFRFSADVTLVKLLQQLDVSKFVNGRKLITNSTHIEPVATVKLDIHDLTIDKVQMPLLIEVNNTPISQTEAKTDIILKAMEINLLLTCDIKAIFVATDKLVNSPVKISINKIDIEYHFKNGEIELTHLNVEVGNIDIKLNNKFLQFVIDILKKFIINKVNETASKSKDKIQKTINDFIHKETVIKVPVVDIAFNLTSTESPNIVFSEKKSFDLTYLQENENQIYDETRNENEFLVNKLKDLTKTELNLSDSEISEMTNFLSEVTSIEEVSKPNHNLSLYVDDTAYLQVGVRAYAFSDPKQVPSFLPAPKMTFDKTNYSRGVSFLLSDYTINSLLKIAQLSNLIRIKLDKDSKIEGLPFKIDTEGLSTLVSELSERYKEKKDCVLKIGIPALNLEQPRISTSVEVVHFEADVEIEIQVIVSDDPFEDPEIALNSILKIVGHFDPNVKNNELSIEILYIRAKESNVKTKIFESFDNDNFVNQLNSLLEVAKEAMLQPLMRNIKLDYFFENYTPFSLTKINYDQKGGFHSVSFDIEQQK